MPLENNTKIIGKTSWNISDHKKMEYSLVQFSNKDLAIIEKKIGEIRQLNGEIKKEVEFQRVINYGNDKVLNLFNKIKESIPHNKSVNHSLKKVEIDVGSEFKGKVQNIMRGRGDVSMHTIFIKNADRQFVLRTNNKDVIDKLKLGQDLSIRRTEQGLRVGLVRGLKL